MAIESAGSPIYGTTAISGSSIIYKPAANFNGTDSFTYAIKDGFGGSASATVNVTVNPVNDAPVAIAESISVVKGSTVTVDVLANDKDADGDILALVKLSRATRGTATIVGSLVSYKAGTKTGKDSFTYTVSDGKGGSSSATVTVNITP